MTKCFSAASQGATGGYGSGVPPQMTAGMPMGGYPPMMPPPGYWILKLNRKKNIEPSLLLFKRILLLYEARDIKLRRFNSFISS